LLKLVKRFCVYEKINVEYYHYSQLLEMKVPEGDYFSNDPYS